MTETHDGSQRRTHTSQHSASLWRRKGSMATYLVFHEVDDVDHSLSSPKREELFGPLGITMRPFRDPQGSAGVGLIGEIPDFTAFQEFMQSKVAAGAMRHDGVHPERLLGLSER